MKGDELRRARELAGLTQAELAERLGVSLRTIRAWESGEHSPRNERAVEQHLIQWKILPMTGRTRAGSGDPVAAVNADLLRLAADHQAQAARHAEASAELLREVADRIE